MTEDLTRRERFWLRFMGLQEHLVNALKNHLSDLSLQFASVTIHLLCRSKLLMA